MKKLNIQSNFTEYQASDELTNDAQELLLKAIEARDKAYAPYSQFSVGAAVRLDNKEIVTGNNQENAAYPSGMCAERVAVWSALSQFPGVRIKQIFISARSNKKKVNRPVSPCGSCRQTLAEYEIRQKAPIEVFFTGETGVILKADSVRDLLPFMFDNTLL